MGKKRGWFRESARHALARKGIKTKTVSRGMRRVIDKDRQDELLRGIRIAEQAGDKETAKEKRTALKNESEFIEEVAVEPKAEPEEKEEPKKKRGGLRW